MLVLPVLLILSAVAINLSYLQLSRTELMVASDLSAHAGGRALSARQSIDAARDLAISTAALNRVAGRPLRLNGSGGSSQIEFGTSTQTTNSEYSKFQFTEINSTSARRLNAIRIHGRQDGIAVFFPGLMPASTIKTEFSSVSMQVDRDIALVFDRSGSMRFFQSVWPDNVNPRSPDALSAASEAGVLNRTVVKRDNNGNPTGYNYSYARGQDQDKLDYFLWNEHFKLMPPARSPWEKLLKATDAFVGLLSETPNEELVSVTTYSSNARNDLSLSENYSAIMSNLYSQDVNGGTAIGLGMTEGVKNFSTSKARPFASKTMVVLTDGVQSSSTIDPISAAKQLVANNPLTIHTISFGTGANKDVMREVARIGNGRYYDVEEGDSETLTLVFQHIVNNLPTILVQ